MSLDYRNIGVLFSLNTFNIILNVTYSTLTVYYFGTSAAVEAFFAATVLGTTVARFVQTGQLMEIIIPRYHKIKQESGSKAAMSIVAMLTNFLTFTALMLVLLLFAGGEFILQLMVPGFEDLAKAEVLKIFYWTGLLMPIQIATNLFQGMLNAENIYGKVELTNTLSLLISIGLLSVWGGQIDALVLGLILSILAQFLTTVYYLKQIGYKHSFTLRNHFFSLRELFHSISATSFYMVGVQLYIFIFNASLSLLPPGTYAIYRYAEVIYGKVANVFMSPISTVFFNQINNLINNNNAKSVKKFVAQNLNFSYFMSLFILLPFWAGGKFLIWTLWGGEKFTVNNVTSVYELLCIFFLTMICTSPYMIFRKLAITVTHPEWQYYYWGIMHVISASLSYLLIRNLGFKGVMFQVFLHSLLMALVPFLTVLSKKRTYLGIYEAMEVAKITLAFAIGAVAGWKFNTLWGDAVSYSKITGFLIGTSAALISSGIFISCCLLLKVHDIHLIQSKILKRIK
ncbi:murein biosynthesis integral membrane protein MurJ [Runella aurantiaca]|uniref:Uncharacterized protein n=1 Tax=Runella aurantiaca TaxID=2282308 RepID=A0A369IBJ5_9BACT|nr:lipid II flippase MurJ [Runella aurantiaca]RDB07129.1 hypothetical protein DVG78_03640 [Runella aurantiaca]